MLKGINHTVIEVNETENDYYERAILIIRPEFASAQRAVLENEARRMLRRMGAPSAIRSARHLRKKLIIGAAVFAAGVISGMLFFLIGL